MGQPFYKVMRITRGSGGLPADSCPVYLDRTQRTELDKCDKAARGVMGERIAKRNEWTEDMSGLQGEDSFFISKLF